MTALAPDDYTWWSDVPERVICDGGVGLRPERWSVWRHGTWHYRVTAIPAEAVVLVAAMQDTGPVYGQFMRKLSDAYSRMARTGWDALKSYLRAGHDLHLAFMSQGDRRRHCRRCVLCNPASYTQTAVNGREYHRRQQARRRRARR